MSIINIEWIQVNRDSFCHWDDWEKFRSYLKLGFETLENTWKQYNCKKLESPFTQAQDFKEMYKWVVYYSIDSSAKQFKCVTHDAKLFHISCLFQESSQSDKSQR